MSKSTKRKHVVREVLEEFITPTENQQIVKVIAGRGNNLHEVITSSGDRYLASMPSKFRKNVWIKRGNYVVTEPIEEGDKVKAEIVHVLYKYQIRHLKLEKLWPVEFQENIAKPPLLRPKRTSQQQDLSRNEDDDEEQHLFVNTNRPTQSYEESASDSSTDIDN